MARIVIEAAGAVPGDLADAARRLRLPLAEMHPGTTDPGLAAWYAVDLPDEQATSTLLDTLRALPSVTAAYVKPVEGPP